MNKKELKIGIVGHGFVGKATDKGFIKNTNKFIVDLKIGTNIDQLADFNPEIIFLFACQLPWEQMEFKIHR